jgi:hypothetical protein
MHAFTQEGGRIENCRRGRSEAPRKYRGFDAWMPNPGLPCPARGQTRPRDLPIVVHEKTSLRRKGTAYAPYEAQFILKKVIMSCVVHQSPLSPQTMRLSCTVARNSVVVSCSPVKPDRIKTDAAVRRQIQISSIRSSIRRSAPQRLSPRTFSRRTSGCKYACREGKMKARLLGKTRSALMLLMLVTAPTHVSAQAQSACPPPPPSPTPSKGAPHPALLASYRTRPPWKVAGIDYPVGVPSGTTLTDWQSLSGPGITVRADVTPPYVRVDDTSNVVISGVDFSLHDGAYLWFKNSPSLTVINSNFGG